MNKRWTWKRLALFLMVLVVCGGFALWHERPATGAIISAAVPYIMDTYSFETGGFYRFPRIIADHYVGRAAEVNAALETVRSTLDCAAGLATDDLRQRLSDDAAFNPKSPSADKIAVMTRAEMLAALQYESYASTTVTYAKNDIFSLSIHAESDCGGVRRYTGDESVTFDMKTGREVSFRDVFANYTRDHEAIAKLVQTAYAVQMWGGDTSLDAKDCIDSIADSSMMSPLDFATYYVSDAGIHIVPSVSPAALNCSGDVLMPVSSLAPYLAPNNILRRL